MAFEMASLTALPRRVDDVAEKSETTRQTDMNTPPFDPEDMRLIYVDRDGHEVPRRARARRVEHVRYRDYHEALSREKGWCCANFSCCDCCSNYFFGVAPGLLRVCEANAFADFFVNTCLRSIGQVTFCDNPLSGILVILACAYDYEHMLGPCCYGVFCVVIANITAMVLSLDRGMRRHGLFGFNAFLVGIAISIFLESTKGDWTPDYAVMFATFTLGIFVVFVQLCVGKLLSIIAPIPVLTLPFNIITLMFLFDAERQFSLRSVNSMLIHPSQVMIHMAATNQTEFRGDDLPEGILKGLSEIYVINNMGSGAIILLSILIYSRVGAALAAIGSIIGFLSSILLGASNANTIIGLWGYNPALTMMAIGGVFMVPGLDSTALAVAASVFSQVVWSALVQIFAPWGMPVCTFPFCIATVVFMCIRPDSSGRFKYVPLAEVTTPEEHFRKWGNKALCNAINANRETGQEDI